jgi:hypothetical protein
MSEQLEHVRRPNLPWRIFDLTECGLQTTDRPVISRADLQAKWKRQGQQRAALTTCMTCLSTAQRWPSWDEDPAACLGRETYMGRSPDTRLADELRAIALLVEAHRDEFDQTVASLTAAPSLAEARSARRRRA